MTTDAPTPRSRAKSFRASGTRRRRWWRLALASVTAAYLWWVASLTLGPQPEDVGGTIATLAAWFGAWGPTAWITEAVVEFIANVVLFLPAGALSVLWTRPSLWPWAGLVGLTLSGAIEATQAALLPDRFPDVRDLVANTLGAVLGALALTAAVALLTQRASRSRVTPGRARGGTGSPDPTDA